MVKNMAEQENFTKCLVEGYRLNNTIQSLRNHIGVFKDVLERATATPIETDVIKEMESNIKSHLKKIRETPCMTKDLQNAVGIETMIIEDFLRKRDWQSLDTRIIYLEIMFERWMP
jgi:hypothetical protein